VKFQKIERFVQRRNMTSKIIVQCL